MFLQLFVGCPPPACLNERDNDEHKDGTEVESE